MKVEDAGEDALLDAFSSVSTVRSAGRPMVVVREKQVRREGAKVSKIHLFCPSTGELWDRQEESFVCPDNNANNKEQRVPSK